MSGTYQLVRPPVLVSPPPVLDEAQQRCRRRVAAPAAARYSCSPDRERQDHDTRRGGGGPGRRGHLADRILTLTFSRKAAAEPRDRIAPGWVEVQACRPAWTFHAFAYALAGETRAARGRGAAPAAPVRSRAGRRACGSCCAGASPRAGVAGPTELAVALAPGVRRRGPRPAGPGRGLGLDPADLARLARRARRPTGRAPPFLDDYLDVLDARARSTTPSWSTARCCYAESAAGRGRTCARRFDLVVVDEYQDTDLAQERLLPHWPATAATWSWSATPTSPSTPSVGPRSGAARLPHPVPRGTARRRRRSR